VLERRLRLGDATSAWAHFGELVHDILERAEAEVVGTGARHAELDRVLTILDETWDAADFGPPALTEAWKGKAIGMLSKLYERWPGRGEPIGLEVDVESDLDGVRWIGRVDRLERNEEGELRVVDYKTSTHAPTQDEAAESVQLGFYALALARSGEEVVASEMWLPRVNTVSVTTRQFSMHRLPQIEQVMERITSDIAAEDWSPRVSNQCKRCEFKRSCPAWPEGRGAFLS
jgi:putative RecB family exonuclease